MPKKLFNGNGKSDPSYHFKYDMPQSKFEARPKEKVSFLHLTCFKLEDSFRERNRNIQLFLIRRGVIRLSFFILFF